MKIVNYGKIWFSISATLVATSLLALIIWGLKPGIDFTGGSLMRIDFTQERPNNEQIKEFIKANESNYGQITYQPVGSNELIFKFKNIDETSHQELLQNLLNKVGEISHGENQANEIKFDSIGPTIGRELREKSQTAIVIVLIAIVAYIAWAFRGVSGQLNKYESFRYGIIAIIALIHDVTITLGVFAILGRFLNVEINSFFIAAILTTLGYSVNDTIIIFDRIRENLARGVGENFQDTINISISQTMVRSLSTSLTTLFVLFSILILGGPTIFYFILALIIGITAGTYSSIFLAAPLLVWWKNKS